MNTYGDTFTLVKAALVDGYGGQRVRDWSSATRVVYAGSVQPVTGSEDAQLRETVTARYRVNTAAGVPVESVDRVEWRGHSFEVVEGPELHGMTGRADHLEVLVEEVTEPDE